MLPRRSVLIVDQSEETREVLRTALLQCGAQVLEASRAEQGLELARQHHPDVIVLDLEIESVSSAMLTSGFAEESQSHHLVLLGSARRARENFPAGQFVAKPYHYGPLIRRIERLLDDAQQPVSRGS